MIERMGADGLIYQLPVYDNTFSTYSSCVEYTGSRDRLGEKTYLNALYYQALKEMAWLGNELRDERSDEWVELAATVHKAYNERFGNEDLSAFCDSFDRTAIPQDCNALAVLFGLAEGDRAKQSLYTLQKRNWSPCGSTIPDQSPSYFPSGTRMISPPMNTHEVAARFCVGDTDSGIKLIKIEY